MHMGSGLTVRSLFVQGQRQVRKQFEAFLGQELPQRRPAGGSPMVSESAGETGHGAGGGSSWPRNFAAAGAKVQKGKAQKRQQAEPDAAAEALARSVQDAIAECVQSGALPAADYPAPRVAAPTAKQSKALPATAWCVLQCIRRMIA